MLVFKRWLAEGVAQISYIVGDDTTGTAAVIDPRPDCQVYIDYAREQGVAITHIFETHIHADFMSGSQALADRLGGVPVYVSGEGASDYRFSEEKVADGQTFEFGSTLLRARFTPGHTPEHMAYEVCQSQDPDRPWGVFSGDSLFVGSAGRPDLLGEEQTDDLVEQLYETLYDYYLGLEDEVIIYPGHGKGSPCGPDIAERLSSSMGYERKSNRYLQHDNLSSFKDSILRGQPVAPTHFPRLKKVNAEGPATWGDLKHPRPLTPSSFQQRCEAGDIQLVDTRHMLGFGGGHINGAVNLGANNAELSIFAGWMLDPDIPILLVLEDDTHLASVITLLMRTGFTRYAGYLAGGMTAWNNEGLPIRDVPQLDACRVTGLGSKLTRLDVRQDDEWGQGHLPDAEHFFFGRFLGEDPDVPKDQPVVTYCTTGYRASMAASILQKRGWECVHSFPGSWKAWESLDMPVAG